MRLTHFANARGWRGAFKLTPASDARTGPYTHDAQDDMCTRYALEVTYLRLWRFSQPMESSPAKLCVYLVLYPQHGQHLNVHVASEGRGTCTCFFL